MTTLIRSVISNWGPRLLPSTPYKSCNALQRNELSIFPLPRLCDIKHLALYEDSTSIHWHGFKMCVWDNNPDAQRLHWHDFKMCVKTTHPSTLHHLLNIKIKFPFSTIKFSFIDFSTLLNCLISFHYISTIEYVPFSCILFSNLVPFEIHDDH